MDIKEPSHYDIQGLNQPSMEVLSQKLGAMIKLISQERGANERISKKK